MHKHASTNRFYRLVWSHVHACWVAVAEGARGRGKSASRKLTAALAGAALSGAVSAAAAGPAGFAPPPPALNALPTGPQVVAGQAAVSSAANQMTVRQGSDKAILNWQSFDIGANAGVRFIQPSASAVALNRVLGNDPSRIYGSLSANGKVFLVNQSGVLFGASARVDVGGLVASSLALPDGDFLAGRYTFSGSGGTVRNEGSIRTADGGYAVLLGGAVTNTGSIVAPNGSVALGAGEQVGVDLRGDGLITLRVDRGTVAALAENSGLLQADGGRVELSAKGADALARATVNNTGVVQARGLVADGGSIRLVGDGAVRAGALDASSRSGTGGSVAVEGGFVALDGAIDAGGARGGSVTVKATDTLSAADATRAAGRAGDGGAVSYRSAGNIVESASASIDAGGSANGGTIGVQGDTGVLTSASYSARAASGTGGRIDVSGGDVRLLGAQLDASGGDQGGLVRVGGAFQGGAVREDAPDLARFVTRWDRTPAIANAGSTFVGDGSAIKVGAIGQAGQGGTAVVWSDKQTTMLGKVDARGAGAAGTVEISSKDELRHVGLDNIALGSGGQLLLDPKNITIGSGSIAGQWTYQTILGKGYSGAAGSDPGNLDQYDYFGQAVALNAAGTRLAVGAPGDSGASNANTGAGAVRLFSFTDNNFSGAALEGTLGAGYTGGKNLNVTLTSNAQFGSAVALNADATRLAVGALGDGSGAVRLFSFGDGSFSAPALTHTLGAGYGTANLGNASAFGSGVALNAAGDRLAVGALGDVANGSCGSCGAVYLFNNAVTSPTFVKAIGPGYAVNVALPQDAQFGTSVALDASGDKLAVGAYGVDDARGAVYLFTNTFGSTTPAATIGNGKTFNVPLSAGDGFSSVALNADGTRLAVGATSAGGTGSVYIIDFADTLFGTPSVSAILGSGNNQGAGANANLESNENFGYGVALNGAGNRLVVGSPYSDGNLSDGGGYGSVRAFKLTPVAGNLGFSTTPASDTTVDAAALASALDGGTSITLQANNDITLAAGNAIVIGDGSGNGALKLQAGRSVILNSSITTGNANLTIVANETAANGVVNAYRDTGAAVITTAAGTTINAGTGQVSMTVANGAGKTNSGSGAITIGGGLLAGSASLKNLGTSAGSDVVIGAGGSIAGTANGLIEIVASNAGSTFLNNAGAAGINPGAGRYLVYSNNPSATLEGLSAYNKHYAQAYSGAAPAYAASGNWFLYSITPALTVSASAASKTYDGTTSLPALAFNATGFIDGDNPGVLSGSLGVTGAGRDAGTYAINAGTLGTSLGYVINFTGNNLTVSQRVLNATVSGVNKTYDGNASATVTYGDDRIAGDVLSLSGSASFANKDAGIGKAVSVTGITLGGAAAGNYTLASTTAGTSADIARRVLNVSATGLNKTYDGGTAANVVLGDDRVAGDVLATTADAASFAGKDAGSGRAVNVTGIAVSGQDAANYTLASSTAGTTADILRRTLVVSASGQDKVYDGGTAATVGFGDDRIAGDQLAVSGSAAFADKKAGDNKAVSVSGIALSGQDANNYTLASATAATSASIAKRTLNATATGVGKTYDGNAGATVGFGDDRVAGDQLGYSASASYADKNAGSNKAITVTGIALSGQDAANYTLASTSASTSADIAQRTLAVNASASAKVYDGNTAASVVLGDDRISGDQLAVSGSANFSDKNAGSGKTVNVSGLSLSGQDAANYTLASATTSTQADITRRTLNASVAALDKVYDGTAAAQVGMTDDRVAGDQLAVVASGASFADKNVGSNKAVSVSGLSLSGQDAGNYLLAASVGSTTAAITPRTLHATALGLDKTYDGGTSASVILGDDRVAGDALALAAGGASFADKNAGSAKAVNVTGITLDGTDAANYTLASSTAGTTANILRRTLAVSASGQDKVYDGGTVATVGFGDDRIAGDQLAVSGSAVFADKKAGDNKAVSVSGIALSGQDANNYTLAAGTAATSASIAKRTLNASATGVGKTYDGGTAATVILGDDRVLGDVLGVSNGGASYADKNAGSNKAITVTGIALSGQDAANYTLASTSASASADIAQRTLAVNASASAKVYDGGTAASVVLGDDRISGDRLAVSGSANFSDKNAGSGKTVNVSGLSLSGQDAANYTLASATTSTRADITRRTLNASVAALDKVYDGSTAAQVGMTDDRVAGDQLAVVASGASFADKNVGSNKAVSVSGLSLSGQDAGNYLLAASVGSTTAAITPRTLNATALGLDKTYDGGTATTVTLGDDRVAGDVLSVSNGGASFADKNAGSGKAVNVTGIAVSGQDAANYTLASSTAGTTANILRRTLAVSASGRDKVYDGGTVATVGFGDDRIAGDQLAVSGSAVFADKNAGGNKAISVSGIGLSGQDANNYTLASATAATSASIAKRTLNATATGVGKTYDGGTAATVVLGDDRVLGDVLGVSNGGASYADKNAGSNKAITVTGIALSGQDAANYTLASTSANASADIAQRTLAVSASAGAKVYDGNTAASVVLGDDRISGDRLAVSGSANFSDKNAGSNKAVSVSGLTLSGQDAANYTLASATTSARADITRRTLNASATGVGKTYDGSTAATVVLGDDRVLGDVLGVSNSGASFADKNVGGNKAISVSGLSLSGQDAGNYVLAAPSLSTSAAITPKALTAQLGGGVTKVYDGNTRVALAAGQATLDGFVAGEGATVGALAASFDSANVQQARSVQAQLAQPDVVAANGTLLSNYALPASVGGAGAITPKALTVSGMRPNDKVYDGTTGATLASIGTLDGLVAGESLQLSAPASVRFDTRSTGSGKLVTASGYRIADGAKGLASNYALAGSATSSAGTITQATLTVKAGDATRAVGLPNPAFGYSVSGLVAGDSPAILPQFVTATSATPASAPGTYAITVGTGTTLSDYRMDFRQGQLTVTGVSADLTRAIRAAIQPVLPGDIVHDTARDVAGVTDDGAAPRALPRVDEAAAPAGQARVPGQRIDGTVITLSGGTQVLTRNGGIRTAE